MHGLRTIIKNNHTPDLVGHYNQSQFQPGELVDIINARNIREEGEVITNDFDSSFVIVEVAEGVNGYDEPVKRQIQFQKRTGFSTEMVPRLLLASGEERWGIDGPASVRNQRQPSTLVA